jgi:L,D-transpeptidase catalytic domain
MRWVGVAAALVLLSFPARADIRVVISKPSQQMAVSVDGAAPYVWTISTGKPGYTTPSGNFNAIRLEEVYYSKKYDDAPMPNAVFFYGGYAIHGTLEERHLGNAVSHGCVRLSRAHAATLFGLVRAHGMNRTRIVISDEPLRAAAPVARYDRGPSFEQATIGRDYDDGYRRDDRGRQGESYDASARRYDRGYQSRGLGARAPAYRGFEQFAAPRYQNEPSRRVYWDETPRRYSGAREQLVPGRTYSEAEMRRIMRDNGWR